MGRFYNTAGANPLDYMNRLNVPLMEKVIEKNDQYIDANLGGLNQLDQLANYNHLIGDDEDAQKIISGYRDQVDNLTKAIQKDPANWRKQLNPIRDLSRKLQTDYESGPISKQVYNYNQRKSAFDAIDKQVELYHTSGGEKGVDPTRALAYKNYFDSSFDKTGYDSNNGTYNVYKGGNVMDNMNVKKILSDGLDKIKADKSFQYHEDETGNGWFFNKETQKVEQITPERVLQIATSNITPQMMQYLQQDANVGLVKGIYDDKGNFIKPYSYSEVGLSPEEDAARITTQKKIDGTKNPRIKEQLQQALDSQVDSLKSRTKLDWKDQSYFTPILKGLVGTYAYKDVEQGNDLSNNSKGSTMFNAGQAWDRQSRTLGQQYQLHKEREANLDKRLKDKFDFERYKWDNPHTTGTGTKKTNNTVLPIESTVSRVATNSFEDWTTYDPKANKDVPVLSIAGLVADIDNKKTTVETLNSRIKQINADLTHDGILTNDAMQKLKIERGQLQFQKDNINTELNDRRTWYKTSFDAALNNHPSAHTHFDKDQVALYKEFDNDRDGNKFTKHIQDLIKQYPDEVTFAKNSGYKVTVENPQVVQARQKLANYFKIQDKVNNGREKFLESMREDIINSNAIQLGQQDSKDVSNLLFSNTQGYKIYDNLGNNTNSVRLEGKGISWFAPKADNFNMTFADNSLPEYIRQNNVKVNVVKFANTTKLGSGNAIVQVTFDDPNGEIPKNKPYYIEVNSEMQKDLANRFINHKNPEVASIAKDILDDEGNNIRKQLMRPSVNKALGVDNQDEPGQFTIFVTSNDGRKIPLDVTTTTENGSKHLHVTMTKTNEKGEDEKVPFAKDTGKKDNNGNTIFEPFRKGAIPGFFNGMEDFIQQYKIGKYGEVNQN